MHIHNRIYICTRIFTSLGTVVVIFPLRRAVDPARASLDVVRGCANSHRNHSSHGCLFPLLQQNNNRSLSREPYLLPGHRTPRTIDAHSLSVRRWMKSLFTFLSPVISLALPSSPRNTQAQQACLQKDSSIPAGLLCAGLEDPGMCVAGRLGSGERNNAMLRSVLGSEQDCKLYGYGGAHGEFVPSYRTKAIGVIEKSAVHKSFARLPSRYIYQSRE